MRAWRLLAGQAVGGGSQGLHKVGRYLFDYYYADFTYHRCRPARIGRRLSGYISLAGYDRHTLMSKDIISKDTSAL